MKVSKIIKLLSISIFLVAFTACSNSSDSSEKDTKPNLTSDVDSENESDNSTDTSSESTSDNENQSSTGSEENSGGEQQEGEQSVQTIYKKVGTQVINDVSYDIVEFGSYPQTEKSEDVTVPENPESKVAGAFTYYKLGDDCWYVNYKNKYYKVEPIKWRILTTEYDHDKDQNASTSGKKLLLAENILDRKWFDGESNLYESSDIREWLTGDFYSTAFTSEEQNSILETKIVDYTANGGVYAYVDSSVTDKIFLLTPLELTDSNLGFTRYIDGGENNTRNRKVSDFAYANNAWKSTEDGYTGNGYWWWRYCINDSTTSLRCVCGNGTMGGLVGITSGNVGVVPALCLE